MQNLVHAVEAANVPAHLAPLTPFQATMIAEGVEDAEEERVIEAWQYLHDTGLAYQLQGWFSRTARSLLDAGVIS